MAPGADDGDVPVVDTHIHLWDRRRSGLRYSWLDEPDPHPTMGDIYSLRVLRYGVREYRAEVRFQGVEKAVHVQAAFGAPDPVQETAWVQSLADTTGWPHAIVGFCDLADPAAERELDRHGAHPAFRGVRDIRPAQELFDDPAFRRGYAALGRRGLVFCHEVGPQGMAAAERLVAAVPEVAFCLDQTGMPLDRSPAGYARWRAGLERLAAHPGTVCKIASLGVGDPGWTVDSLRPWVLGAIDAFGPDRCFFGSNWPVDRQYSSYPDLVGAWRTLVGGCTHEEQHLLMHGNAETFFALT